MLDQFHMYCMQDEKGNYFPSYGVAYRLDELINHLNRTHPNYLELIYKGLHPVKVTITIQPRT